MRPIKMLTLAIAYILAAKKDIDLRNKIERILLDELKNISNEVNIMEIR
jgi:hypothetical protein